MKLFLVKERLTLSKNECINKLLALKQRGHILDLGAVPSSSTISTFDECVYDGAENRIDRCESEVELTG